jgi:hypothetical protein
MEIYRQNPVSEWVKNGNNSQKLGFPNSCHILPYRTLNGIHTFHPTATLTQNQQVKNYRKKADFPAKSYLRICEKKTHNSQKRGFSESCHILPNRPPNGPHNQISRLKVLNGLQK